MPDFSIFDSVATLQGALRYIDAKLTEGTLTPDSLIELKSAVDDVRLRLWGALVAEHPSDYNTFRQAFRIQRAVEICGGVQADLQDGTLPWTHAELQTLGGVAASLAACIARGAPRGARP